MTAKEEAIEQHSLALFLLSVSFQGNANLLGYVMDTETNDWPSGEMHEIMQRIGKYFKKTTTTSNKLKQEIKKEQKINEIEWKRNTNPK